MEWTFIQTGAFYETTFQPWNGFDLANLKVTLVGDGNTTNSLSSISDFTQILPDVLSNPKSKNATINLVGEHITYNQVIDLYEKKLGKTIQRIHVAPDTVLEKIKANPTLATWAEQIQYAFGTGTGKLDSQDQAQFSNHMFKSVSEWLQQQ